MSEDVDPFPKEFRVGLSMIEQTFDRLNTLIANTTEHDLQEDVTEIEKFIDQSRRQARAAQKELNRLMDEEGFETSEKIADWRARRLTSKLHARADRSERCAVTAIEIAVLAMDEAERAVLRALLTRKEAISIQVQQLINC
jgi:predicted metal-dependent hydrolase